MINEETLETVSETGMPTANRLSDIHAAYTLFTRLKNEYTSIAEQRAIILKQYNGCAPYKQDALVDRAEGWRSNVNPREHKSIIDLTATSLWDMFTSVPTLITANCVLNNPQIDSTKDYGDIIARNFTRIIKENWTDFYYHLMLKIHEMLITGYGVSLWGDEYNWRSETLKTSNLYVPFRTRSTVDNLEYCFVRSELSAAMASYLIVNSDTAEKEGWDIKELKKAMVLKYREGDIKSEQSDMYKLSVQESSIQQAKNLEYSSNTELTGLDVIHMYVRELDDSKVSHYCFLEGGECVGGKDGESVGYLLSVDRQYDSMHKVFSFLTFNIGDGYLKSIKGLSHEIFGTCEISMRLLNSVLDAVTISSGLLLSAQTATAAEKFKLVKKGPVTIIPENTQALQSTFSPPLESIIQVRQVIKNLQNTNTGTYQDRQDEPDRRVSATEARIMAQNEARFESNQAAWYYSQWDSWLQETFKRLINPDYPKYCTGYVDHLTFVTRCKEQGVPPELLFNAGIWSIRAVRSIGYGSPIMKMGITSELMSVRGELDELGRKRVLREFVGARMPWEDVDQIVSSVNRNLTPSQELHTAESESVDLLKNASMRTVSGQDVHMIHIQQHIQMASMSLQEPNILQGLELIIQHIQQHLQYLAMDPTRKNDVKAIEQVLKQLLDQATLMKKALDQQNRMQQQQQQEQQKQLEEAQQVLMNRDADIERYKVDKMAEVEMYKASTLDNARRVKTKTSVETQFTKLQTQLQADMQRLSAELSQNAARTNSEIQNKSKKTASDIALDQLKAVNKIRAESDGKQKR